MLCPQCFVFVRHRKSFCARVLPRTCGVRSRFILAPVTMAPLWRAVFSHSFAGFPGCTRAARREGPVAFPLGLPAVRVPELLSALALRALGAGPHAPPVAFKRAASG